MVRAELALNEEGMTQAPAFIGFTARQAKSGTHTHAHTHAHAREGQKAQQDNGRQDSQATVQLLNRAGIISPNSCNQLRIAQVSY
jgi:hypothetical protein